MVDLFSWLNKFDKGFGNDPTIDLLELIKRLFVVFDYARFITDANWRPFQNWA